MVALKGGNKSLFAIRVHEFTAGRAGQRQEKLITEVIRSSQHRRRGPLAFTAEDGKVAEKNRAADFADERRLGKQTTKNTKDRKETRRLKEALSNQRSAKIKGAAIHGALAFEIGRSVLIRLNQWNELNRRHRLSPDWRHSTQCCWSTDIRSVLLHG
jgi:hypothetical protein